MLSFVEPASLMFAFGAAKGIDRFVEGERSGTAPVLRHRILAIAVAVLMVSWSIYRLVVWPRPVTGWKSVAETCMMLLLFVVGLMVVRTGHTWMIVIVCLAVWVDYKVCGTSRPFSALPGGDSDRYYPRGVFLGIDPKVYDVLKQNRQYRLSVAGVHPTELRRYGLATPQGFDPLLSAQFKTLIEQYKPFRTNRIFDLQPTDSSLIQLLGVRYFLIRSGDPSAARAAQAGIYQRLGESSYTIEVYEYRDAKPSWQWDGDGTASPVRWEAELREFTVQTGSAGNLILIEQFYPGWRGSIDGREVPIERWKGVFQLIGVPAGTHAVRFEYRPLSVLYGVTITGVSLLGLAVWLWSSRPVRRARSKGAPVARGTAATAGEAPG
jgi:hypothetical protein